MPPGWRNGGKNEKDFNEKSAKAFERRGDFEESLREFCEAGDFENVLRVARVMDGRIEAWSYLDKVPLDCLIQDVDLAAQCFVYNLGKLKIRRCRVLYEKFKEHFGGTDIFRAMQFADAYMKNGGSILPDYQMLTAEQIDGLPVGAVSKAMILVENSIALLEHMQYEEAEKCIDRAIHTCAGINCFADFFAYNQMAQICEETGRLNDSLACYAKSRELFKSQSMMSGVGTNYYFGLVGVYMRRMELAKAAETLEYSRRILDEQHIHMDILDMTLNYHLAEMKFLSGDANAGAVCVDGILSEYPAFNVLTLGRLIHELDCAGLLSTELAGAFLKGLETAENYRRQPFMRLLRARILFGRGGIAEALKETEEVLAFSRAHKNRLRLIEAGLQKIFMLSHTPETAGKRREINNLLREAIYYAYKDRILMPFYLDRAVLSPLLSEFSANWSDENTMSEAESSFLRDVEMICGRSAVPREQEILSAREKEVLGELARGITNREIAEKLCISQATVKTHVLSIFGKLGVSSRMMAVDAGRKKGLI